MQSQASIWGFLADAANNFNIYSLPCNAGAPTSGTSGTGANLLGPGSLLIDTSNKALYINTNTKASPTWTLVSGGSGGGGVTLNGTQTLTNKTLGITNTLSPLDTLFSILDDGDNTKILKFQASGITTGTTRTLTAPDASGIIALLDAVQTFTNKTQAVFSGAAAGSTQADGVAITTAGSGIAYITGANATKGAVLPVGTVGAIVTVVNDAAANAVLKIYGNTGDSATINGVAGSTAYSMAAKTSVQFVFVAAGKWQTLPLVAS